jgi:uncharacterized protein with NRDE domain
MCTVTWLPLANSGFILTSNRDEAVARQASNPVFEMIGDAKVLFPKDPKAGGTWIATNPQRTVCLLNGAFEKHAHQPPYRRSRGLMLLDSFEFASIHTFSEVYDFEEIEPFTLVVAEGIQLFEMRWNGTELFLNELNPEIPHIWASSTLYSSAVIHQRKIWFEKWLSENKTPTVESIIQFHQFSGDGNVENDLVMRRGDLLKTLSITAIKKNNNELGMHYLNLLQVPLKVTYNSF